MATFVTPAEYEMFTGRFGSDVELGAVEAALNAACDTVRAYLNQTLDVVANDVVTIYGTGTRALVLPELPVTSVDAVTLDGVAVTDWTLDPYGLLWRTSPDWWLRDEPYVVTYDHGYATVPAAIKQVAAQIARRGLRPIGVRQESTGPFSVTYTDDDSAALAALDRFVVKRIPVP